MGALSPGLREWNYSDVKELRDECDLSYESIASFIRDKTQKQVTALKVEYWMEMQEIASEQKLVSSKTMKTVRKITREGRNPQPT